MREIRRPGPTPDSNPALGNAEFYIKSKLLGTYGPGPKEGVLFTAEELGIVKDKNGGQLPPGYQVASTNSVEGHPHFVSNPTGNPQQLADEAGLTLESEDVVEIL